jgi:hypothetical protein
MKITWIQVRIDAPYKILYKEIPGDFVPDVKPSLCRPALLYIILQTQCHHVSELNEKNVLGVLLSLQPIHHSFFNTMKSVVDTSELNLGAPWGKEEEVS